MKRIVVAAAAGVVGVIGVLGVAVPAQADPITCPPGQETAKNPSDGGWVCVNKGGNENESEQPKNKNKDKGDFRH